MHRHTSIGRDSDNEDPTSKFNFGLRSARPMKKLQSTETNDSGSSGEEDDEDGFEILTAENLFSTLLSRVSVKFLKLLISLNDFYANDLRSSLNFFTNVNLTVFFNNFRCVH